VLYKLNYRILTLHRAAVVERTDPTLKVIDPRPDKLHARSSL
jgi:hypothetical protein